MGFMVLGCLVAFTIPKYLSQKNALALCALGGIVFAIGVMQSSTTDTSLSHIVGVGGRA